jgi:hypothetical protein
VINDFLEALSVLPDDAQLTISIRHLRKALKRATEGAARSVTPRKDLEGGESSPARVTISIEDGETYQDSLKRRLKQDGITQHEVAQWTRDGSSLLYSAVSATGNRELYRVPADRSTPPAMVVHGDWPIFESSPSPKDGPLFFRDNAEGSGRDIYIVRKGEKPAKFAASQFQERSPAVSPDGGLVLYTSNESGTDQVYARRVDGEERAQVSTGGGSEPRWTPAGREALYWNGDTLFAVSISTTLSVGARRSVLVGVFAREPFHSNYDVSPDGKTFVMLRSAVAGVPATALTVLLNWFDSEHRAPSK